MQQKIIITLDGHSSCGKSTYAKKIDEMLGYISQLEAQGGE